MSRKFGFNRDKRKDEDTPKTNDELIQMLQRYPGDLPVWTEGCDCIGATSKVVYDAGVGGLLIKRRD